MSLLLRLDDDLKKAMKASDALRVSVIRMVKASVKNQQIDRGRPLSDEEILSIMSTLSKQRRESIDQFSRGGREELAEKERQELEIIQSYMPRQLSQEELDSIILQSIQETSARSEADLGRVMKVLMPRVKGLADGKWVNNRAKELLRSLQDIP